MSVLDKIYSDEVIAEKPAIKNVTWCEKDNHNLYEYFTDFNEWIDGVDSLNIRLRNGIDDLFNCLANYNLELL